MTFVLPFCTPGCPDVRVLQQLLDLQVEVEPLVRSRDVAQSSVFNCVGLRCGRKGTLDAPWTFSITPALNPPMKVREQWSLNGLVCHRVVVARRCGSLELRRMDLVGNRGTFEGQACQNETIDVVRGDRP